VYHQKTGGIASNHELAGEEQALTMMIVVGSFSGGI
jgi:hypothetical protein